MTISGPLAWLRQHAHRHGFALALFALLVYFFFRNSGMFPSVFADEWYYSSNARLLPFSEAVVPSYLYFWLFRFTNACGTGFLDCARLLNGLLFVGAAPFLYLIGRRVCSPPIAALVVFLCMLSPLNSYTAYFMPEVTYFFAFSVLSWAALNFLHLRPLWYGLFTGALLGLMSLIKVHGLFLLPALLAFMLYLAIARRNWLGALQMALMAVSAMAVVRLGLGYLLAGKAGLSLFGQFYSGHTATGGRLDRVMKLLPEVLQNAHGHMMALALLMAVPAAAIALHAISTRVRAGASEPLRALMVFSVLMLGAAVGLTIMFTASLAAQGPAEIIRLHMRYYSFVFPLLLIAAAATVSKQQGGEPVLRRALVALPLAALVIYSAQALLPAFSLSLVDNAELTALARKPYTLYLIVALTLLVLAAWTARRRLGTALFVFGLLPCTMLISEVSVNHQLARADHASPVDKAGQVLSNYMSREQLTQLTVVGEYADMMRVLFHLDYPGVLMFHLAPESPFLGSYLSPQRSWALLLGKRTLPEGMTVVIQTPDFVLGRSNLVHNPIARIDFRAPMSNGVLSRTEGLSVQPEAFGIWSDGPRVVLHLAAPLPKKVTLVLRARAFHPNVAHDFVLNVGAQQRPFKLGGTEMSDRFFEFDTDGTISQIAIDVPRPTTPRSLDSASTDDRLLGVALDALEIGTRP